MQSGGVRGLELRTSACDRTFTQIKHLCLKSFQGSIEVVHLLRTKRLFTPSDGQYFKYMFLKYVFNTKYYFVFKYHWTNLMYFVFKCI